MTAPKKPALPHVEPLVRKVCNSTTKGRYETAKHSTAQALRPGAENALSHPSRNGDRLHHRGGRVTDLNGTPITTKAKS